MASNDEEKYIQKLMLKYESLVKTYSNKVRGLNHIGMDVEDVQQELRIVLYNSIITYSLSYQDFLSGKREKPTPLKVYLMTSFKNFITKLFGKVTESKEINFKSFDVLPYDRGEDGEDPFSLKEMLMDSHIKPLKGLKGKELLFYREYLKNGVSEDKNSFKELCGKYSFTMKKGMEIINKQRILIAEQIYQH